MKTKIIYLAKTNLNNDGRILNELKILKSEFKNDITLDFILLEDKPLKISIPEIDNLYTIDTLIRNNPFLRWITVFVFTLKSLAYLIKIKPDIVQPQDTAVILPVYIYRLIKGKKFLLIYDDHELPNENENMQYRIFQFFERKLMRKSDLIIVANEERRDFLIEKKLIKSLNSIYFLNLPYFKEPTAKIDDNSQFKLEEIKKLKQNGIKFIMHQGSLEEQRGREKLAEFSKCMKPNVKIMIVGVDENAYSKFIDQYGLEKTHFYFVGIVDYYILPKYWLYADATVIMYLPKYINNRLCAPNRLYIAYSLQIPIIVNEDNPVLSNFIENKKCGFYIESLNRSNMENIFDLNYSKESFDELIHFEKNKFIESYKSLLQG